MIGKIINGQLYYPTTEEKQKIVITNPTEDILKYVMGFKNVVCGEKPEYDPLTQQLSETYSEEDENIVVTYTVEDIVIETIPEERVVEDEVEESEQDINSAENEE